MNYHSFCETLRTELLTKTDARLCLHREKIRKNNGVVLDALCILAPDVNCSPIVYLAPLYQCYREGASLESICASVLSCLEEAVRLPREFLHELQDFDHARPRIACRLISRKANFKLLQDIPWVPFLDLAIVFFLLLRSDETNQMTTLIPNHVAELWNTSPEALMRIAKANTPLLFPPVLKRMEELLITEPDSEPFPISGDAAPALYVLTNKCGINGASCILYDDIIKDFADRMEADVLILPSSIHEVMLLPDSSAYDYSELRQMIYSINREAVAREERLSDELYLYRRQEQAIRVWHPSANDKPETGERMNP